MNISEFTKQLNDTPETIEFTDVMQVIADNYIYTPTSFTNHNLINEARSNEGSCKLFSFAKLNNFTDDQTLACFGSYYRDDVLQHPENNDHANIRQFMLTGLEGIQFPNKIALKQISK